MFHGQGGYDWDTVYNMPLWLRRTTFNLIQEYYDKQNEESNKQKDMLNNKSKPNISKPNISIPSNYKTKALKK